MWGEVRGGEGEVREGGLGGRDAGDDAKCVA